MEPDHLPSSEPPRHPAPRTLLGVAVGERGAVLAGFLFFFCLFASYFMLRPVRETMGIAGGVKNLQWLFTATFVVMLAAIPLYGLCSARLPRRRFVPWVYAFFIANLLAFALATRAAPDNVWLARTFYVWLSVFNLFVVSVAWSLMADVFRPEQAKRLFPVLAAGASAGGLAGPVLSGWLVPIIGLTGLMLLSAIPLAATLPGVGYLFGWRRRAGAGQALAGEAVKQQDPALPIGGSLMAGLTLVLRSRYLLGIGLFVILLATASTFLYFEQARLVAEAFPDRTRQTQVFSALDAVVQALTILVQLFFSGRVARRYGVTALLTGIPLAVAAGFLLLAAVPTFAVLAGIMILRRVGEYAMIRPGREMLFTVVDAETKYKAKNVIDTAIYRAGDAVSAWVKTAIDALAGHPAAVALTGAVLALAWALLGLGGWGGAMKARRPPRRRRWCRDRGDGMASRHPVIGTFRNLVHRRSAGGVTVRPNADAREGSLKVCCAFNSRRPCSGCGPLLSGPDGEGSGTRQPPRSSELQPSVETVTASQSRISFSNADNLSLTSPSASLPSKRCVGGRSAAIAASIARAAFCGISQLLAALLLTSFADGVEDMVVIRNRTGRSRHRATRPVGAERAWRDGCHGDAERLDLFAKRLRNALQREFASAVVGDPGMVI